MSHVLLPFHYGLKSKRFALPLSEQWQFISLKWANQFLDFDLIKILALFNHRHLGTEAFWQWLKDLPYYLGILHFLSQIKLVDDHFIQLTIERVKGLVLTHSVSFTFFVPSQVVSNICQVSLAMIMWEIWWNSSRNTPQKIALSALLLVFDVAKVALSNVDLASSGLV